jgi:predicted nucleic acid-binding protein
MVSSLSGQVVYVDANTLIYAVESAGQFPRLLGELLSGPAKVITSWITLSEVLVKPLQLSDTDLILAYQDLFRDATTFEVINVDEKIAGAAAQIRATYGLRLPDAIHVATGLQRGCSAFVTADAGWARAGVNIIDPGQI